MVPTIVSSSRRMRYTTYYIKSLNKQAGQVRRNNEMFDPVTKALVNVGRYVGHICWW